LEIVAAIAWLSFGPLSALFARRRLRDPYAWLVFGIILGPFAATLLYAAPPGRCGRCMVPVRGWVFRCVRCGSDVRDVPSLPSVAAPAVGHARRDPDRRRADEAPPERRVTPPPGEVPQPGTIEPLRATRRARPARPIAEVADERSPAAADEPATEPSATAPFAWGPDVPTATPPEEPPVPASPVPVEFRILGSGVYVGGSAPLLPGARYSIAIEGTAMQVLGPVDEAPGRVVLAREIAELETTMLGDRLIIAQHVRRGSGIGLVFTSVVGASGEELQRALTGMTGVPREPGRGGRR
jgi:hypothetical protein